MIFKNLLTDLRALLGPNKRDGVGNKAPSTLERETSNASTTVNSSTSSSTETSPRHADATETEDCDQKLHIEGLEQSPIDICALDSELVLQDEEAIQVVLGDAAHVHIAHNGSNFRVEWLGDEASRSCIKINGKTFYAVQFHFHAPSEHTLDGQHEAMELHLVHQAADGSLAVVGLFFRAGKENAFLAQFWKDLPAMPKDGEHVMVPSSTKISAASLHLLEGKFFRYRGSLTTPPYSEGVEWIVLQDVAEASPAQLAHYLSTIPHANARDVQPRNHRLVTLRQCACAASA